MKINVSLGFLIALGLVGCAEDPAPKKPVAPFSPNFTWPSATVAPPPPPPPVSAEAPPPPPPPDPVVPIAPLPPANESHEDLSTSVDDFYKYFTGKSFDEYQAQMKKEAEKRREELQRHIDEFKNNPKLRQKIYEQCLAICQAVGKSNCEDTCTP